MTKRIIIGTVCCFLFIASLKAQNIYFAKSSLQDSIELKKAMADMAHSVLNKLGSNYNESFGLLFSVHLLGDQFDHALADIDSMRRQLVTDGRLPDKAYAAGFFFLYSTCIRSLYKAKTNGQNVDGVFKQLFRKDISGLDERANQLARIQLSTPINEIKNLYQQQIQKLQANTTDSISIYDALVWAQVYFRYITESHYTPIAQDVIYIIMDSVKIPMRDGAFLSAVIVRDRNKHNPQPVVMMGNIYASMNEVDKAMSIVEHGYTGVIVNTRGKYLSDVPVTAWENDANDMYDAIDWISRQPWCDGKIGMYGGSYLGFTQWAATKRLHPALKTIVPQVAAAPGIDFPMHNNIFVTYALRWLHAVTDNRLSDWSDFYQADHWDSTFNKWYKTGFSFRKLDSIEGRPSDLFQKWLRHPSYDGYWKKMIPYQQDFSRINIPILTITGYFDGDQLGALYYYNEHHKWNSRANHYLLIGPYDHGGAQARPEPIVNGYTIDSVALINITDLVFKWFDFVLKDSSRPPLLKNKVNYEVMGANKWQHVSSFKDMNNDTLKLYLNPRRQGRFYTLSKSAFANQFTAQEIDLKKRKHEKIKDTYDAITDTFIFDDSLNFISDRFDTDFSINGPFTITLLTSINKKDVDLSASLTIWQPDSTYFNIAGSMQRASYAADKSNRSLLTPGKTAVISLKSNFTSVLIKKGSRLILTVSVLNTPYVEINYGTGGDVADETIKDAKIPLQMKLMGNSELAIPVLLENH